MPVTDHRTMLKLLQLHLERHSPEERISPFHMRVEQVEPRRVQGGLFLLYDAAARTNCKSR